jgi:hypothetical protein
MVARSDGAARRRASAPIAQVCRRAGRARRAALVAACAGVLLGRASAFAAPPSTCVGDCDGSGAVSVSSIVTLVRIALGVDSPAACPLGVPIGATVDVSIGIQAVANALAGCGRAPTATFTATALPQTPTPVATATHSGVCPAGEHRACHGGSGRGGGYKTVCTCVRDAPPTCTTAWGTSIAAGTSVTLYDTNLVYAPDTCAAHGSPVSCDASGGLDPPGAVGYPVCSVVTGETD